MSKPHCLSHEIPKPLNNPSVKTRYMNLRGDTIGSGELSTAAGLVYTKTSNGWMYVYTQSISELKKENSIGHHVTVDNNNRMDHYTEYEEIKFKTIVNGKEKEETLLGKNRSVNIDAGIYLCKNAIKRENLIDQIPEVRDIVERYRQTDEERKQAKSKLLPLQNQTSTPFVPPKINDNSESDDEEDVYNALLAFCLPAENTVDGGSQRQVVASRPLRRQVVGRPRTVSSFGGPSNEDVVLNNWISKIIDIMKQPFKVNNRYVAIHGANVMLDDGRKLVMHRIHYPKQ